MASDAFFPFADGLQILIDGGVKAVVQPGGSKRDDEVIAAAKLAAAALAAAAEALKGTAGSKCFATGAGEIGVTAFICL